MGIVDERINQLVEEVILRRRIESPVAAVTPAEKLLAAELERQVVEGLMRPSDYNRELVAMGYEPLESNIRQRVAELKLARKLAGKLTEAETVAAYA